MLVNKDLSQARPSSWDSAPGVYFIKVESLAFFKEIALSVYSPRQCPPWERTQVAQNFEGNVESARLFAKQHTF